MAPVDLSVSRRLLGHLDASPTPYHAVAAAATLLDDGGFAEVDVDDVVASPPGRGYVRRGGALVAWAVDDAHRASTGLRVVGAHTDSPNLRIKPLPDTGSSGWRQLGVEIYGGVLLNSWLDRDLGMAGRVSVRDGDGTTTRLFRDDRPLLRVPQLAIHLDREIRDKGLLLNAQRHMAPVWGVGDGADFRTYVAACLDVAPDDVVAWEVMAHDLTPATLAGLDEEFVASARIDNLLSCFLAVEALVDAPPGPHVAMAVLFDHEEVGSVSATGAASPLISGVVDRLAHALGGDVEDRQRSRADSIVLSADGAHATHPNYAERHEPDHTIAVNAGPVLKVNSNQRYATDAESGAAFLLACERADVPAQRFVNRTDLACGSTIGPLTAGALGVAVVDAGCAQLAMHSAREMCGSHDPAWFRAAMGQFLSY
jgi:aspartyl aminopeptidase